MNGTGCYTLTGLKRWSCQDKELPPVSSVTTIHIYDFDNTLFATPLPNKQIWNGPTICTLASPDIFLDGGWWHNPSILAATGDGIAAEEPRAWKGWWNEQVATLVQLTMQQKDALGVLLTGRSEARFADLIKRMLRSKGLQFEMVCLKPAVGPANQKFGSTIDFKQQLLKEIVHTYKDADEIRIYEDRVTHVKRFREYFFDFNKALMTPDPPTPRKPITAEIIQVLENATCLNPVTEVQVLQFMINSHNSAILSGTAQPGTPPLAIKKTVFYTAYLIQYPGTEKLMSLVNLPPGTPENDVRFLANSILITPRPISNSILERVGHIGKQVTWRVTGTSIFENKLWAARVEPVPATEKYYTENPTPTVVLALRRGARPIDAGRIQNWHPVPEDKAFEFETKVGEKVMLRIEEEYANEDKWEGLFPHKTNKRLHPREDDFGATNQNNNSNHNANTAQHAQGKAQHGAFPTDQHRPRMSSGNQRGGGQQRGSRGAGGRSGGNGRGGRGGAPGRGGGVGGGGGGGGGGGRSRARGGYAAYKSLDDVQPANGYASFDDY